MDLKKATNVDRLPLLRNFEDAQALYEKEQEPFYLAAFLIQCWLGGLVTRAAAEYAENKSPKEREVQSGESWGSLEEMFELEPEKSCQYLLSCLFRFSAGDDSPGNSLRRALVPLSIEHRCIGDYFGPESLHAFEAKTVTARARQTDEGSAGPKWSEDGASLNLLCRRTIVRWCDWLDAEVHLRTHRRWHESPACFDLDPETRYLAALGNAQRHLGKLDERAKACWLADFATAAEQYQGSPKWSVVGKAMAERSDRSWLYPEVDTLAIALWPLVKAYNWTYRDLLNVIRPGLKRAEAYPGASEQEFAAYCANVLGLRKAGKGRSAKNGQPRGCEIAREWCPALGT